jgi:hypothetical protein
MRRHGWAVVDDADQLHRWGLLDPTGRSTRGAKGAEGGGPPRGQGKRLDAEANRAVEVRAVRLATAWCRAQGWTSIRDVGNKHKGWDLEATDSAGSVRLIEVKGTTGTTTDVIVTTGEVEAARRNGDRSLLLIATGIALRVGAQGQPLASGGQLQKVDPWNPSDSELKELQYRWSGVCKLAE